MFSMSVFLEWEVAVQRYEVQSGEGLRDASRVAVVSRHSLVVMRCSTSDTHYNEWHVTAATNVANGRVLMDVGALSAVESRKYDFPYFFSVSFFCCSAWRPKQFIF